MDYKNAGVAIEAGYESVKLMKKFVQRTMRPEVLTDIGGFSGAFALDKFKNMEEPTLVSGTDGVGTKLKLAFIMDKHDTIGIDCVAMCVNDIACAGGEPLFFLDYIACGKNYPEKIATIVKGVADGCIQSDAALIGGETAEMPGFYAKGDYDISGTIVGVVERDNIIDGSRIHPGTKILGLPSTGLHTNGYSLARKALFEVAGYTPQSRVECLDKTIGEALTVPHRSYYKSLIDLTNAKKIDGLVHVTGSGFQGNIPRILPADVDVVIDRTSWEVPAIFKLIQQAGTVEKDEMYSTFNMGIGMLVFVDDKNLADVEAHLKAKNEPYYMVGEVVKGSKKVLFKD